MDKYVFVVGGGRSYYRPFSKFGEYTDNKNVLFYPNSISLVLFTGGEDVSPSLYGQKQGSRTFVNPARDDFEVSVFKEVFSLNLPIAGVCRGSQFLCVMAGGTLYQHVDRHLGDHMCRTWDNRIIRMSSTHHQMQNPPKDARLLAWADPKLSGVYLGQGDVKLAAPDREAECVHYPNINAIGMQYHPEIMDADEAGFKFAEELVDKFLIKN